MSCDPQAPPRQGESVPKAAGGIKRISLDGLFVTSSKKSDVTDPDVRACLEAKIQQKETVHEPTDSPELSVEEDLGLNMVADSN